MSTVLKGKTVLITRRLEQSGDLKDGLESHGAHVVFLPTIDVVPPDSWEECDRALAHLDHFDLIVFPSVNAVTFFLHRCVSRGISPDTLARSELAVVGKRTGTELERLKLAPQHLPEEYSASSLIEHFARLGIKGKRILLPRGSLSREDLAHGLSKLGATVVSVTVYRTVAPDMSGADKILEDLSLGKIDVVTFASPSAVNNFAGALGTGGVRVPDARYCIAVIGPTTAEAVRTLGAEPDIIASESSARGLTEAIASYYSNRS
ncbi:MAG TPA: uroporphyrinogen-III synthase [Bacteroidota bacterium]|nr:uroporphyrinogen-III synthase [Bacteroidota bacterium]